MEYLYCSLFGYLVGTINPSYLFAKLKGMDIRQKGSGNAGATNALILFGKLTGLICALLDIFKAYIIIRIMEAFFPSFAHTFAVTGTACILGHIYPFYLKFKGGKGLACLGGVILCFDWRIFVIMLSLELLLTFIINYICFVPITASIAFPIIYSLITKDVLGAVIMLPLPVVMFIKHIENLKRIHNGTEMHFSYLWKPDSELERISANANADQTEFDERFHRTGK